MNSFAIRTLFLLAAAPAFADVTLHRCRKIAVDTGITVSIVQADTGELRADVRRFRLPGSSVTRSYPVRATPTKLGIRYMEIGNEENPFEFIVSTHARTPGGPLFGVMVSGVDVIPGFVCNEAEE